MLRKFLVGIFALFLIGGFANKTLAAGHTVIVELTHLSCYEVCDGKAKAIVSGSAGPFTIKWLGNGLAANTTGDSITSVCAGVYTVEVIDQTDNSSTGLVTFEITQPPPFFWSIAKTEISCFGEDDGVITILPSGGTPPYRYRWDTSPNDTLNFIDSLVAGTYAVRVADTNGCTFRDTIVLEEPDELFANVSGTNSKCKNSCDGTAVSVPSGGTAPYSYQWNNGDTNATLSNLCIGKYIVTITDANSCIAIDSITITEPDSLKTTVSVDSALCSDSCNGSILTITTGGIRPYTYFWAPSLPADSSVSGLCAGDYTFTVTDSNGCFLMENIEVEAPDEISITDSLFLPNCGMCNGTIKVFPTGGFGTYRYQWNTGPNDTLNTLSGLCSGTYTVTVTDSNLCAKDFVIALSDTVGMTGETVTIKPVNCYGGSDGSAMVQPVGGTAPFTYSWAPGGQTDSLITGLIAGVYHATITDASGCKRVIAVNVQQPDSILSNPTIANTSCNGGCDGAINVSPTGGQPPYTYLWAETGGLASSESGLCSGTYHLTITDANGCVTQDSFYVDTAAAIALSIQSENSNCFEACNGYAEVSVSGGVPPYSYNWSNGSVGSRAENLCAGDYTVTVTDANGCQQQETVSITSPAEILPNVTVIDSDCNFSNGIIRISPSGGANSFSYLWSNGTTKDSLTGLAAGLYSVVITDTNNCSITVEIPVSNIDGPEANVQLNHVDCFGKCTGSANAQITSGTGSFRFLWNTGDTTSGISGLCAGTYFVQVTEGNGCKTTKSVEIKEAPELTFDFNTIDNTCNGECEGSAYATIAGGTPPYRYSWQDGSSLNAITDLCAGAYILNITDTNNCTANETVSIQEPDALSIAFNSTNISCHNACTGALEAVVSGGVKPYSYSWSNGATTPTITALCEGNYYLTITDANGCIFSDSMRIGQVPEISVAINTTDATCGACDGSAILTPSGGNGSPYTYFWSTGGQITSSVNDLCAGIYGVTISDNLGCSKTFNVSINNIGAAALTDTSIQVSCHGDCDGQAIVRPTGTGPFTYIWNDPGQQRTDTAKNLCAGDYEVLVTDGNSCISVRTITVTEPEELILDVTVTDISCIGDSNGVASVSVSGGLAPYTYRWSTGINDTLVSIDSLKIGTYYIEVTDTLSCVKRDSAVLSDPAPISLSFVSTNALCFSACNGTATVSIIGGSAPYSVVWSDPSAQTSRTAIGLCSGFQKVTVTDANGCIKVDSVLLVEPPLFGLNFTPTNPTCFNGQDGTISLTPNGGTPPYSFVWGDGQTTSTAIGLSAGTHTVMGIDSNGCVAYDTITLNDPTALSANIVVTDAQCDSANGSATATPMGGSGNYSYLWKSIPFQTSVTATRLPVGIVDLTITDNISGCEVDYSVIINNTGGPTVTITPSPESCFGACDGSALAQSPTAISYEWDDPLMQTSQTAGNLCSGIYSVTVTDVSNCKTIDTVTIGTTHLTTDLTSIKQVTCFGDCDGEAMVLTSGGTSPYSYTWNTSPVQNGNTATDLCVGTYEVTSTDSNNCALRSNVQITGPQELTINVQKLADVSCFSLCDGIAEAEIFGGTAPYSYSWSGGQTDKRAEHLCEGMVIVTVTDANGCSVIDSVEINQPSSILANAILTQPSCGEYNGKIELQPSGGSGAYTFLWNDGKTTAVNSDLFAGVYIVEISDVNGCSREFTFFLNNPNAPTLNFAKNTVKCLGDCNGVAVVAPIGGVSPYQYSWDYFPTSTTDSLKELCAGVYGVKVTDGVGCISFGNDTITEPPLLQANPVIDNPGCGGECLGIATANPIGGTTPYQFQWNTTPAITTDQASNLCAGKYQVLITDANDCTYLDSLEIVPPPALLIDSITKVDVSCNDNTDGEATVFASGGRMPYQYLWSSGATVQTATGLSSGPKIILITDDNGCEVQDTVDILVREVVTVDAIDRFFTCVGQTVLLTGTGSGVTSYQWFERNPDSTIFIGNSDSILVVITDTTEFVLRGANDSSPPCFDTDVVIVDAVEPPVVDAGQDVSIPKGSSTVLTASPFLAQGNYAWAPSTGLDDSTLIGPRATPLETTTYVVTVTNELGCFASDSVLVTVEEKTVVYNGFSPNGDGVNDVWNIDIIDGNPNAVVEIYTRWGEQIFRSVGYTEKWDGTYKGKDLPDGTYYFVIDLKITGEKVITGPITLIR